MKISVVIPTLGKRELLERCLEGIEANSFPPHEIFIVGLTGEMRKQIRPALLNKTHFINLRTRGASQARNLGIKKASGEIIAFLDDDCFPDQDWLSQIAYLFEKTPLTSLCGQVLSSTGIDPPSKKIGQPPLAVWLGKEGKIFQGLNNPWLIGGTGNLAVTRELFPKVGYFDENLGPGTLFKSSEDADFIYRILKSGIPVLYSPAVKVRHWGWRSEKENLRLRLDYGIGMGAMLLKHASKGDKFARELLRLKIIEHLKQCKDGLSLNYPELLKEGFPYCCGIVTGLLLASIYNLKQ